MFKSSINTIKFSVAEIECLKFICMHLNFSAILFMLECLRLICEHMSEFLSLPVIVFSAVCLLFA